MANRTSRPVLSAHPSRLLPAACAGLALLLTAGSAHADASFSWTGTNANGKIYNRPSSSAGVGVRYQAQSFGVPSSATCTVRSTQSQDGVIYLYKGSFDPLHPTTNLVTSNDDGDWGQGSSELEGIALLSTSNYVLVTAAYSTAHPTLTFQNTIDCSGVAFIEQVGPSGCEGLFGSDDTHACLAGGRFDAFVSWTTTDGQTGSAHLLPFGTDEAAIFSFFSTTNPELMVKVLNGCPVNNKWWIFSTAMTNVQYTLQVADTVTGSTYTLQNAQGQVQAPKLDTTALPCP